MAEPFTNRKPPGGGQTAQRGQPTAGLSSHTKQAPIGLLSRRQLAERWGVCVHTIARRPDLVPVRFNRRLIRYRLENIEAIEAAAGGGVEV